MSYDTEFVDFVDTLRINHRSVLSKYLIEETPSIRDVAENTIKYCNANGLSIGGTVYLLKFPSGKYYAGQTINFKNRMGDYSRNNGSNDHMSRALVKYGFENVIIDHVEVPEICMDLVEIFMIWRYDLMDPSIGYNKLSGGSSGWVISDDVRMRMSKAMSGENNPMYGKIGENCPAFGKPKTGEQKAKQRVSMIGKMVGKNHPMFGINHTIESKNKMSVANSGKNHPNFGNTLSVDTKKKISTANTGKRRTNESRMKNGERKSKPVVVDGMLFRSSIEASRTAFKIPKNDRYVSNFIRENPETTRMFYISDEFYNIVRKDVKQTITMGVYNNFLNSVCL
jgi:hypothetical protein